MRSPSPRSGRPKPSVPISDPGGPLRISVVAALGSSFMSPSRITAASRPPPPSSAVEVRPDRRRLRGPAEERVGRVACALILVDRREAAREGEQLRLQVRGDEGHVARSTPRTVACRAARPIRLIVGGGSGPGGSSPTWIGSSSAGKGRICIGSWSSCRLIEGDPDPAIVGRGDRPVWQRVVQRRLQPLERALRTDLLKPEHVRSLSVDHRPQRLDLGRELLLRVGAVLVPDLEQVLDVPAHDPKMRHARHTRVGRPSDIGLLTSEVKRYTFPPAAAPGWRREAKRGETTCLDGSRQGLRPAALLVGLLIAVGVVAAAPAGGASGDAEIVRVVVQLEDPPLAKYRDTLPGIQGVAEARTADGHLDVREPASREYLAHVADEAGGVRAARIRTCARRRRALALQGRLQRHDDRAATRRLDAIRSCQGSSPSPRPTTSSPSSTRARRCSASRRSGSRCRPSPLGAGAGLRLALIDSGVNPLIRSSTRPVTPPRGLPEGAARRRRRAHQPAARDLREQQGHRRATSTRTPATRWRRRGARARSTAPTSRGIMAGGKAPTTTRPVRPPSRCGSRGSPPARTS